MCTSTEQGLKCLLVDTTTAHGQLARLLKLELTRWIANQSKRSRAHKCDKLETKLAVLSSRQLRYAAGSSRGRCLAVSARALPTPVRPSIASIDNRTR